MPATTLGAIELGLRLAGDGGLGSIIRGGNTHLINNYIKLNKNDPDPAVQYVVQQMKAELERRRDIWYRRGKGGWGTKEEVARKLTEDKVIDLSGLL